MRRRKWDSKTKIKIVLEGLSPRPVSEICNDYGFLSSKGTPYLRQDSLNRAFKLVLQKPR